MTFIIIIWLLSAWVAGWLMFHHVPFLTAQKNNPSKPPAISIIIPARNEAASLPKLLASIQKQHLQPLEVLVVDDQSKDETRTVAKMHGSVVLAGEGEGKAAACWQGAQAVKGEWLLFLDADTFFESAESLAKIAAQYQTLGGTGILSLQPYHATNRLYEQLSFVFNVIIMAGLNAFSAWGSHIPVAGAFGPSILCAKEDYQSVNGHEGMAAGILDDLALAQRFKEKGLAIHLFGGKHTLAFRMHPKGLKQLIQGWSKDFATASKSTHPFVLLAIILWISGAIGVTGVFFLIEPVVVTLFYGLFFTQCLVFANRVGNFHVAILLFYPCLFLFFLLLFAWSFIRTHLFHSVTWKGRKVPL